ncbi:patatin-like phospholipase family protein [Salirhabdus sp. Marseille-P4669]|uniref:patatin-like phospholipase family protein n=1 Tax=Salirhabdus sp. Marseille-P4669 TaxID=2042310 RepID=UPI000C7B8732|nr:patatin family protein [Salirhabdus sp. Marseille-P4669]
MKKNVGLVLEGGGMRGVFTGGVLRFFMEKDIYLPYVIGVSAGACNGSSYVARQMDRNKIVNIDYISHPDYISIKRFLTKRELFGMDFLFDILPNKLAPFDFETFNRAEETFVVGTTDCKTGKPVYFEKSAYEEHMLTIMRASSSIPYMAPIVEFEGRQLLDGGIADPIPIRKAEEDGYLKNIVILTRNKGYVKDKASFTWLIKRKFGEYKGLVEAILNRHELYNETVSYLEDQEAKGNVLLIRPPEKLDVGRVERNQQKLLKLYEQGFNEAKNNYDKILEFLNMDKEAVNL